MVLNSSGKTYLPSTMSRMMNVTTCAIKLPTLMPRGSWSASITRPSFLPLGWKRCRGDRGLRLHVGGDEEDDQCDHQGVDRDGLGEDDRQDHVGADDAGSLGVAAHSGQGGTGDQADADAGADGAQTDGEGGGELESLLIHGNPPDGVVPPGNGREAKRRPGSVPWKVVSNGVPETGTK